MGENLAAVLAQIRILIGANDAPVVAGGGGIPGLVHIRASHVVEVEVAGQEVAEPGGAAGSGITRSLPRHQRTHLMDGLQLAPTATPHPTRDTRSLMMLVKCRTWKSL